MAAATEEAVSVSVPQAETEEAASVPPAEVVAETEEAVVAPRRTPLEVLVDHMETLAQRRIAAEAEIGRLTEAERAAVDEATETPGESPYLKGRPAFEAREKRRKLAQELEDNQVELAALGRRKELLTADESAKRLEEAIGYVAPLQAELAAAFTDAGELVAAIVRGPWQRYRAALDELVAVTQRGEGIAGEAQAADPNARAKWAQAVSCPLEPVPTNVGWFVEAILLAAFDPGGTYTGFGNRKLAELVPNLRGEKAYAAKGRMTAFTSGSPFAHTLDTSLRHALDPYVPAEVVPNEADAARNREIAAENERIANIHFSRLKKRTMEPVPQAAGWRIVDESSVRRHEEELLSATEQRDLAMLQAKDGDSD